MTEVNVHAPDGYRILIAPGLMDSAGGYVREVTKASKAVIVSDDNVYPLYGAKLTKSLGEAGFSVSAFVFEHGESSKSLITYERALRFLSRAGAGRSDAVIALGGGVAGDLAGFAAATYMRGIDLVQIPTSLLAAVDSSVGGKTAVNLGGLKNQIGAFYRPKLVICDTDTLNTLPEAEYINGCAEVIKHAVIGSEKMFDELSRLPVHKQYEHVITRCVRMKAEFVEADEHDTGARMALNFGHTAGHAIEAASKYSIRHGEAVAIGMAIVARAASAFGYCPAELPDKLDALLKLYSLPVQTDYDARTLARTALSDKKRRGSRLTLVLPRSLGEYSLESIEARDFEKWLRAGGVK